MFRIVQEALNNVSQHTALTAVRVQIWADDERLQVHVEDQGPGFDLESTLRRSEAGGLMRMHGRAVLLAGHLRIESVPGMGTTVQAVFPAKPATLVAPPDSSPTAHPAAVPPSSVSASNPDQVAILLADSHDLTRQGMRSLLETEPAFAIVGEATQGRDALDLVEQLSPAILIVDFALPGLNGIDITRYVTKHVPDTQVLIISLHEGEAYVIEALKSGATGYALKQSAASDLIQAVYEVAAGRRYLSPTLSERAIDVYLNLQHNQDDSLDVYGQLTLREREVLQRVVDGLTSAEIGEWLGISPRTVEKHRANMMQKLGLRNQADLVRYALEHGLTSPG